MINLVQLMPVIPGPREAWSPQSITAGQRLWIPDLPPAKSAAADLAIHLPISGKSEIGDNPK